jgi:hypothetical protein
MFHWTVVSLLFTGVVASLLFLLNLEFLFCFFVMFLYTVSIEVPDSATTDPHLLLCEIVPQSFTVTRSVSISDL